jgi:hypothetical protein
MNIHQEIAHLEDVLYIKEIKMKKTKSSCYKCDIFMYKNHMKLVCDSCLESEKSDNESSNTV